MPIDHRTSHRGPGRRRRLNAPRPRAQEHSEPHLVAGDPATMAWQATPTPAPVIERVGSGVAVVGGRVGRPRRIADDLLPTSGSSLYILAPDGEIDQRKEV
jgi:hypothetical protein